MRTGAFSTPEGVPSFAALAGAIDGTSPGGASGDGDGSGDPGHDLLALNADDARGLLDELRRYDDGSLIKVVQDLLEIYADAADARSRQHREMVLDDLHLTYQARHAQGGNPEAIATAQEASIRMQNDYNSRHA